MQDTVCIQSNTIPGSFCYELTLNGDYSARLNYGSGRDRYYKDTEQYPDVVNKVLYGHRTIIEPEFKKKVVTPDNRTSVN